MRNIVIILACLLAVSGLGAQELNCNVTVDFQQITGTETRKFKTLESAIYEFMNNRKWTKEAFNTNERIECDILIVISKQLDNRNFEASIQIQSRRPVYNSGYYSPLFVHKDNDFTFNYLEYDPLEYNINSHLSNLTSVLAFYAYIIIGLDYDSFELRGGSKYLDLAQKIVGNAQGSTDKGWKAFESDQNRYYLAQQINDDFYSPLRECIYEYHLKGLDLMWKDVQAGRTAISTALNKLQKIHQARPSMFITKVFFNSKNQEIINIFKEATPEVKRQVSTLCKTVDPGNAGDYDKIMEG